MPKHVTLSLINRFGHCVNYSFSVELETALANSTNEASSLLTSKIVLNPPPSSVFHSDFDNFDKNTANGSIHKSHGIMLQELGDVTGSTDCDNAVDMPQEDMRYPDAPRIPRTKNRYEVKMRTTNALTKNMTY